MYCILKQDNAIGAYFEKAKNKLVVNKKQRKCCIFLNFSNMFNYLSILNFFDNRSTNAAAESFSAKIKAFRSTFRGVRDINFYHFRFAKIYA